MEDDKKMVAKNRIDLRPLIENIASNNSMSEDEVFQNNTLRPIIKMQHDLLISVCKTELKSSKNVFYNLTKIDRQKYIDNIFSKNISFRSEIKGLIIGHFTQEEYYYFAENTSNISKRIIQIVKERIINNMSEL